MKNWTGIAELNVSTDGYFFCIKEDDSIFPSLNYS